MSKRWVTFDLDGTLMQNPFGAWVFPEIAEAVQGKLGRAHDIVAEMVEEHEARMRQGRFVEAYDWDEILNGRLRSLGIDEAMEIEPLVRKHSVPPKIGLLESGIREALLEVKAGGFSLAAVTNGFYKFQAPVMEALGLLELFDEVVTPERAGAGKPDPAILRPLDGRIIAHVGDRLDHDVLLAARAGAAAVLVYRKLPVELKSMSPCMRVQDPRAVRLLIEKGMKESKQDDWMELPKELVPTAVIFSMQELRGILIAEKER